MAEITIHLKKVKKLTVPTFFPWSLVGELVEPLPPDFCLLALVQLLQKFLTRY
jgi:hypothetical protein